jgi:hypothetical protein
MVSAEFPVPEQIPGILIEDRQHQTILKEHLAELVHAQSTRSALALSFAHRALRWPQLPWIPARVVHCPVAGLARARRVRYCLAANLDPAKIDRFWVCEKSDGVRVLVCILGTEAGPEVYLVRPLLPHIPACSREIAGRPQGALLPEPQLHLPALRELRPYAEEHGPGCRTGHRCQPRDRRGGPSRSLTSVY